MQRSEFQKRIFWQVWIENAARGQWTIQKRHKERERTKFLNLKDKDE